MPLLPKIIVSSLSDFADSVIIRDVTGIYSGSNLGGFSSPNVDKADIVEIVIQAYNEGTPELPLYYRPIAVQSFLLGGDQIIKVDNFGSSGVFSDGVLNFNYNLLLAATVITSVSNLGKTLNSTSGFKGNEQVVVVGNNIYKVDPAATNTTSVLNLLSAIPLTTASVRAGYTGSGSILNNKKLASGLAKQIGIYAGRCSCNTDQVNFLCELYLKKIGSETRFSCNDIKGAHSIVVAANNLLTGGCSC